MLEKKMYINGELVGNEKDHSVICPADLKEIGSVAWKSLISSRFFDGNQYFSCHLLYYLITVCMQVFFPMNLK